MDAHVTEIIDGCLAELQHALGHLPKNGAEAQLVYAAAKRLEKARHPLLRVRSLHVEHRVGAAS